MTIKAREFDVLVDKLGFETRNSKDKLAWLIHEGRIVVRTRRSQMKGGDVPLQHVIRQQMKLNEDQLRAALQCTFTRENYIQLLKSKRLID